MEGRPVITRRQPLRVLFYVQHLLGIGHLMRAGRVARALQNNGFQVTLVTGGVPVAGIDLPEVKQVCLPPIAVRDGNFSELVDARGNPIDEPYKQRRRELLLQTYRSICPDIVILEAFPFGRRLVRFELLPLIEAIGRSTPKPILVASIRDILQKRSKPDRDAESAQLISQHFDKVLVHGDAAFATLDDSFPCTATIADQLIYTGLVGSGDSGVPQTVAEPFDIVVSAGGGAVGARLVQASLAAAVLLPETGSWCVITGPNMPTVERAGIENRLPARVTVEQFRKDFPSLLYRARLSISQAGYNTVSDILQARCRSIVVPYSAAGETEQTARAARLQHLGLATVLSEPMLSGENLASLVRTVLERRTSAMSTRVDTNGADRTAEILQQLAAGKQ